jgi:hypothetical protein
MRRIILPGALLLAATLAAACEPAQNTNSNANRPPANANANAAASPSPAQAVSATDIIDREKQLYDSIKRKDWDAFGKFLADDQVYVTSNGTHDRAKTLETVKNLDLTEITLTDAKVVNVDKDLVVVTYTSNAKGTFQGRPIQPGAMRESTAWVNRGGTWLAVYHQDSEVQTAPAAAATAAPTPAGAAAQASPAASPAMTDAMTSTDVEKQIWDALKRKDYNAFAAMLTDDALDVEAAGVFDKQATIDAVKRVDFSRASLGDFREIKIDADATLVVYVVTGPPADFGPKGERHATVQVKRNGRWLAAFHQGTRIQ